MSGSVEWVYTLVYLLLTVCLIAPPSEVVSLGLTVQNLLSGPLGSEHISFVHHHIRRTTATLIIHSLFPLGYYLGLVAVSTSRPYEWLPWHVSLPWQMFLVVALVTPLLSCVMAAYWYRRNWSQHPIARTLQTHAPSGSTWMAVASSINVEFRRIDKFTTGSLGRRVIVTDSWLMKTTTYFVHVAHQQDVHLSMTASEEHQLSPESYTVTQFLNIQVNSAREQVKPFTIRLNATEFNDLKEKLHSPVRNARNIIIHQSLSDRFLQAFRAQVQQNDSYVCPEHVDLEPCIGCMQTVSNVKLVKLCDEPEAGSCVPCYCRPMWCLECMSKWFASRQDQTEPQRWLGGSSPCPTCRSRFCVLDVCRIVPLV